MKARGSVNRHKTRHGAIVYRARMWVDGERQELGLYPTEANAKEVLALALAEYIGHDHGMTLRVWGGKWLDRRETDGLHRKVAKSRSTWRTHIDRAPFADSPMRRIKRTDVVRWLKAMLNTPVTYANTYGQRSATRRTETRAGTRTLARQTVVNALALLRRALTDAADEGHVASNVVLGVGVPRKARDDEPWTYLSRPEIEAVLALELRPEQRAIFTVAIFTGLRGGEIWGLRWSDVTLDGARQELFVRHSYRDPTKSGKTRRVPLLPQARDALLVWKAERPAIGNALVFPADGLGCHVEGFDCGWTRVRRLAGIERRVRFHDLRHTCHSHLVMGTWAPAMRLEDVRLWGGWSTVAMCEKYAHLGPDRLHAIAEIARRSEAK